MESTHAQNIRRAPPPPPPPLSPPPAPAPARQPSARHNPFAPQRVAASGRQLRKPGREEEEKGRKANGSGRDHRHPPPHSSPRLPPSGLPVDSRPHPRRAGPICSAAPPASSGALLPGFTLFPSLPPRLQPRGRASLSVGPGMARAPDLLRGRRGVGGC